MVLAFIEHSLRRLLVFCSHVILYFAVLCRVCGNIVIKHYLHSQMDLRPFVSLGLSRIREFLNGFTSKKDFLVAYEDLVLKMDIPPDWKFCIRLWAVDNRLSWRTNKITDAFQNCFRSRTNKEIPVFSTRNFSCSACTFSGGRLMQRELALIIVFFL